MDGGVAAGIIGIDAGIVETCEAGMPKEQASLYIAGHPAIVMSMAAFAHERDEDEGDNPHTGIPMHESVRRRIHGKRTSYPVSTSDSSPSSVEEDASTTDGGDISNGVSAPNDVNGVTVVVLLGDTLNSQHAILDATCGAASITVMSATEPASPFAHVSDRLLPNAEVRPSRATEDVAMLLFGDVPDHW